LTGHTSINCPKEFESDEVNTFCVYRFKKSKFYKGSMNSSTLLPPRNVAVFESQFPFEYYTQSSETFSFSVQICMLIQGKNVNNAASKDSPTKQTNHNSRRCYGGLQQ